MNLATIATLFFGATLLGSGLFIALTRRLMHAGFGLFFLLFSMAALLAILGADFLAVSQIIIYVGGILVLLLFGIMLTSNRRNVVQGAPKTDIVNVLPGLLAAGGVLGLLFWSFRDVEIRAAASAKAGRPAAAAGGADASAVQAESTIEGIGQLLLTDYLLLFELMSVILLVALVAAAYIARRNPPQPRRTT
jgi:NADH-quinone oxidoreductase subunit J